MEYSNMADPGTGNISKRKKLSLLSSLEKIETRIRRLESELRKLKAEMRALRKKIENL
jgi:uncharacterized small protein (DUF1192 family)